ncbi:MAG: cytidine deaminase [Bacteroidales bacterium]|nr:cytidine deaminase [Bacteroidales bacterium]
MKKRNISIEIIEYQDISELDEEIGNLIKKAEASSNNAYTPYSKFNVGAAILLDNGDIVCGNNQENAAYPSGLCAERVALFYANASFPTTAVKAIAIVAKNNNSISTEPVPPCGSCRQALLETETRFGKPIKVYLSGSKKIQEISSIKDLLPLNFDKDFLHNR